MDSRKMSRSDRKSTRLNSSHANISYAVFCLKKNRLLEHLADEKAALRRLNRHLGHAFEHGAVTETLLDIGQRPFGRTGAMKVRNDLACKAHLHVARICTRAHLVAPALHRR